MIAVFPALLWQSAKERWPELTYREFREAAHRVLDDRVPPGQSLSVMEMAVLLEKELTERYGRSVADG
jgi:hypothetical protein